MDKHEIEMVIEQRNEIEELVDVHSEALNRLPKHPKVIIKEEARNTDFYKYHEKEFDKHFEHLRQFNSKLTNQQKRAIQKYKRQQRYKTNQNRLQRLV